MTARTALAATAASAAILGGGLVAAAAPAQAAVPPSKVITATCKTHVGTQRLVVTGRPYAGRVYVTRVGIDTPYGATSSTGVDRWTLRVGSASYSGQEDRVLYPNRVVYDGSSIALTVTSSTYRVSPTTCTARVNATQF